MSTITLLVLFVLVIAASTLRALADEATLLPEVEHHTPDLAPLPELRLETCPECACDLVYPVSWKESEGNTWLLDLHCPNCGWRDCAQYQHEDVERFDSMLNRGTDSLAGTLETLARENMEQYVQRFVEALHSDHILPVDF